MGTDEPAARTIEQSAAPESRRQWATPQGIVPTDGGIAGANKTAPFPTDTNNTPLAIGPTS